MCNIVIGLHSIVLVILFLILVLRKKNFFFELIYSVASYYIPTFAMKGTSLHKIKVIFFLLCVCLCMNVIKLAFVCAVINTVCYL